MLFSVLAALLLAAACSDGLPRPRVAVIETGPMPIDRIYTSMAGPFQRVRMNAPGMDWITGFKATVVEADSGELIGDEFFCHSQLQLPDGHRPIVTATGISEIRFPKGYGVALYEAVDQYRGANPQPLSFLGMLLNNYDTQIDVQAKVRAEIEYLTQDDVGDPPRLKKLYSAFMPMTVEDLAEYIPPEPAHPAPEGQSADEEVTTHCALVNGLVNHWMVPPGLQLTRKRYSGDFLGVDVTIHTAVVHLHNHGRYMRLTDLTRGEIVWQSDVVYESDRAQIVEIPIYSSAEGFVMRKDHEYEVEVLYDNTTDHDVDAMAMLYLYFHPIGVEG